MKEQILAQGAEAKIILKNNIIIKNRIPKSYRIKELDDKIRKHRTKTEKKLLEKATKIIDAPNPLTLENDYQIKMPFINGKKLSDNLNDFSIKRQKQICKTIGKSIAKLHEADIIHGDLTTSNMIWVNNDKIASKLKRGDNNFLSSGVGGQEEVFFIDLGLGFISKKIEDKAVDLHLLKQALEAKHFKDWEILFNSVLDSYKEYKESKKVLERLKTIEKRGRYKF